MFWIATARQNQLRVLEQFHQCYSGRLQAVPIAVFLGVGFVSAQLQVLFNLRLRQSLAQPQKSSLPAATSFLSLL